MPSHAAPSLDEAPTVHVNGITGRIALGEVASRLDHLRQVNAADPVALDLSDLRGRTSRVAPQWGAVFTNLLMTEFQDLPLTVAFPSDAAAQIQLARSGLWFALARHRGLRRELIPEQHDRVLQRWRANWRPADGQQALFTFQGDRDDDVPKQIEHELVAFLNPNKAPRQGEGLDRDAVTYPWLRELVHVTPELASNRELLAKELSLATKELLDNVRHHAKVPPRGNCSISLFITGNGSLDRSRLYLSVLDTGVGIPATIRRNYADVSDVSERSDAELLAAAFNGQLPWRERDRGRGLNRIQSLVQRTQGQLFVASGPAETGAVLIEQKLDDERPLVRSRQVEGLRVNGTVVVISFLLRTALLAQTERE